MKKAIPFLAILLLAGCATSQVAPENAKLAPKDRVTAYQTKFADSAMVTITRDSGFVGGGCLATVFIDGAPVARLNAGEKAVFYIQPGQHILGSELNGKGLCAYGESRQEREILINSDESRFYRIFTDANGGIDIKPTTLK